MPLTVVRSNNRYKQLLARGATSLSVHFDLPTLRGHDSDTPAAAGHVGGTGVAVDSIDDMRVLLAGIPLERISLSMAADAAVAQMVLLYQLAAEEQGIAPHLLRGTAARRLRVFPPGPSGRLDADLRAYCRSELPHWGTGPVGPDPPAPAAGAEHGCAGPAVEVRQAERMAKLRAWRCRQRVASHLLRMQRAALGADNVMYPMKEALAAGATIGEVHSALRRVWGAHGPGAGDPAALTR
ncbi:methylmalonyl-CoA mutase family protein [Streptomyces sp. NPDC090036]|uniref:methylmalonyl-CoA mutase family protein n=1 Tax=Streptomyces sp. NPDC090036 TaxID=3365926 RepID=UPI0037F60ED0